MGTVVALRTCTMALITLIALSILQSTGWAQKAPTEVPPEKVRQLLEVLNEPDVKAWLESKAAPPPAAAPTFSDMFASWESAVRNRIAGLADAVPRISQELANGADVIARDVNDGRPGLVIFIVAVLVAVGFGAEWLVRQFLPKEAPSGGRNLVPQAILTNLAALLTFALASIGSFLALEWPPLLRRIVLTLLIAIIAFRVVRSHLHSRHHPVDHPAFGVARSAVRRRDERDRSWTKSGRSKCRNGKFLASAYHRYGRYFPVWLGNGQHHARCWHFAGSCTNSIISVGAWAVSGSD